MTPNLETFRRSAFAFLTATLVACGLAASAALADDQVRSETVRFADLDAGTQAGAQALYGRIHDAIERVCYEPNSRGSKACAALAERRAIEQLNLPLLTAYYEETTDAGRTH